MKKSAIAIVLLCLLIIGCRHAGRLRGNGDAAPAVSPNAAASGAGSPGTGANPFGVMPGTGFPPAKKAEIARELGARYIRTRDIKINEWSGDCADCDAAANSGLGLILTVRNRGGLGTPSVPPDDIDAYKKTLGEILARYTPAVLIVENEENSAALFYSGTPDEYHKELKAACEVAHASGIKCANGGIVSSLAALLVADSYYEKGDAAKADEYFARTIGPRPEFGGSDFTSALKNAKVMDQIDKGKKLISGYKDAGADYINFHWYFADAGALQEAVAYLESETGLPAMTNEVGQQKNEDPVQVANIMAEIKSLGLPYAVWFSMDISGFAGARALNDADGRLRPNGLAFKAFIEGNYP